MPVKLIAFNGPPRSGKDTGANTVQSMIGRQCVKIPLALILKEMTCRFFNTPYPWDGYEGMKDKTNGAFWGMTPRQAYIWMSEEVIKPKFGKDFFGKELVKRVDEIVNSRFNRQHRSNLIIVVSDVGFIEEWEIFQNYFGEKNCFLIQLFRPKHDFNGDSRSYIYQDLLKIPDGVRVETLDNNKDIEVYENKVQSLVRTFIRD